MNIKMNQKIMGFPTIPPIDPEDYEDSEDLEELEETKQMTYAPPIVPPYPKKYKMYTSIVYLATPYSHKDPKVEESRFKKVNKLAAKLMKEGEIVFSPISHTHPIALAGDLPKDWTFWEDFDRAFLKISKKLIVFKQKGWEKSTGVDAEIKIAEELNIPIEFMDP